jgi:LAO/AO transport system kinase
VPRAATSVHDLLARARAGDQHAIARALSIVENDEAGAADLVKATHADSGGALVVGLTGPPGGGKSTLAGRLIGAYRRSGQRVAVVAVDPSSPFTGGAILGDRIRMREQFLDEGVFIRSMASRGHSGGLARATRRVVELLAALGFGVVIVETVGVGQEEVEVVRVANTVCLVTVPGLGDGIQALKAGVLEVADVLVVNKADRPGVDETVRDLAFALSLGGGRPGWKPPIVRTSSERGEGTEELIAAIAKHVDWSAGSGEADRRQLGAARAEVESLLRDGLLRRLREEIGRARVDDAVSAVARRERDPYSAVDELLQKSL